MKINIDQKSTTAVSEQIFKQMRRGIVAAEIKTGTRIATVRQMAFDLEVAPNTVAKAYYQLSESGFLELQGRKGTFVSERWRSGKREIPDVNQLDALGQEYIFATIEAGWDFTTLISHLVKISENISGKKIE